MPCPRCEQELPHFLWFFHYGRMSLGMAVPSRSLPLSLRFPCFLHPAPGYPALPHPGDWCQSCPSPPPPPSPLPLTPPPPPPHTPATPFPYMATAPPSPPHPPLPPTLPPPFLTAGPALSPSPLYPRPPPCVQVRSPSWPHPPAQGQATQGSRGHTPSPGHSSGQASPSPAPRPRCGPMVSPARQPLRRPTIPGASSAFLNLCLAIPRNAPFPTIAPPPPPPSPPLVSHTPLRISSVRGHGQPATPTYPFTLGSPSPLALYPRLPTFVPSPSPRPTDKPVEGSPCPRAGDPKASGLRSEADDIDGTGGESDPDDGSRGSDSESDQGLARVSSTDSTASEPLGLTPARPPSRGRGIAGVASPPGASGRSGSAPPSLRREGGREEEGGRPEKAVPERARLTPTRGYPSGLRVGWMLPRWGGTPPHPAHSQSHTLAHTHWHTHTHPHAHCRIHPDAHKGTDEHFPLPHGLYTPTGTCIAAHLWMPSSSFMSMGTPDVVQTTKKEVFMPRCPAFKCT